MSKKATAPADDSSDFPAFKVSVGGKRPRPDDDDAEIDLMQKPPKISKQPDDEDAPIQQKKTDLIDIFAPITPPKDEAGDQPQQQQQAPPAAPVVQEIKLSPHVIYPDQYGNFDKKLMTFSKDPVNTKDGGGQSLYISYVYQTANPTSGAITSATKPLMINTPNGMHLPTGITTWNDGKYSTLLSTGHDGVATNPVMAAFQKLFADIQTRCIEIIMEKQWNSPNPNTFEAISDNFTPIMFEGMDAKGKTYPPSIKATVIVDGKNRTEVFEYSSKPPMHVLMPSQVLPGSAGTAIIHVPWIYRKKSGKLWKFSVRVNLFQMVVELPSSGNPSSAAPTCSVCF